jgi:hypothetical protein
MKMQNFWSTLAAVLVAAGLIFGIKWFGDSMNWLSAMDRQKAAVNEQIKQLKAQEDFAYEMIRLHDPTAPAPTPVPTASPISAMKNTVSVIRELFAPPERSPSP